MGNPAKKFIPRSARYILRPGDRKSMRYSLQHTHGPAGIEQTVLVNLSETGVAFIVPNSVHFEVGEMIKVEIPIPNGSQIAWWGRVVRVEEHAPRSWQFSTDPFREAPNLMVGLRFEDLPGPHTRAIRKGIEASFVQAMRDQRYRTWLYYKLVFFQNFWKILGYIALTILAIGFIYLAAQPSENYDSKRGAPWGERFKFF